MDGQELRRTLALANAFKEGDLHVGGTRDEQLRAEARHVLLALPLRALNTTPLVDDGVSAALATSIDRMRTSEIDGQTVAQVKDVLTGPGGPAWTARYAGALSSEAIATLAKVMSDDELSTVARALFNPLPGDGVAIGSSRHFGSRIQPNSAGDDDEEILFSIFDGLCHGCGDVIIGLNPASDDPDSIVRLEALLQSVVDRLALPTRSCVLSDLMKQSFAQRRTRVDVGFQSLAGTSKALAGMVGLDVDGVLALAREFDGLYFETGQGAEVTNGAADGVDMVTLEARTYGVARHIAQRTGRWTIVNDVAGFIGPEVFRTVDQLERACLEDTVMAKLHGLTMGLDVCATFHMGIPPAALRGVTERLVVRAAPAYLMAVAGNADPMLGYLTTSFHQHPRLRRQSRRRIATAMSTRLSELGAWSDASGSGSPAHVFAAYAKAGGDRRTGAALVEEGERRLAELRSRGLELGGSRNQHEAAAAADARVDAIYAHARDALYATLDPGVLRDASPQHLRVRSCATDRDEYLAHPHRGETISPDDVAVLLARRSDLGKPALQLVVSDGLNANAFNEHGRTLLPQLRRALIERGHQPAGVDLVVQHGRVRAGYHLGGLLAATLIVHLIGERPGTGLNTLSAYLTFGLDPAGGFRWSTNLDHACTTAICGIHPRGKRLEAAAVEIAGTASRILDRRRSGVALHGD